MKKHGDPLDPFVVGEPHPQHDRGEPGYEPGPTGGAAHQTPDPDPMSGYASADVLEREDEGTVPPEHAETTGPDPMSGYASADLLHSSSGDQE